ncbi:hypothetical protein EVG20_g10953 [Dentipellis fragilis]|uniref:Thioredoxin domain-containing protein n=1 Tax=Dentipellis fragilis TaxID=205917 RepID=A0A4Y9XQB0_9AGAM|nr:hypothetical protein EVG20_g10953 [Dentipellis fragilis]
MSARIQKPAPAFTAIKAVVAGQFVDVSLSDYLGKWSVVRSSSSSTPWTSPSSARPRSSRSTTPSPPSPPSTPSSSPCPPTLSTPTSPGRPRPRASGGLGPNLQLPLLADRAWTLARSYGVLLEEDGVALRGQFLIDPKGVLRQATINDLPVGRSVDEALRLVKAFRFTEEHGEVCPANWTEGSRTIKADPTGSLEYFANANANANGAAGAKRARED